MCALVVDDSAERSGTNARCLGHGALQRQGAGCVSEASRSSRNGVDLDDREHPGGCVGVACPSTVAVKVSPFAAVNVAAPVECLVMRLICPVMCSVYLPRYVAVPPPSRVIERIGKTVTPVSTALTVPLNGVSAATALTAMLASDTAVAATSAKNSGRRIFIPFPPSSDSLMPQQPNAPPRSKAMRCPCRSTEETGRSRKDGARPSLHLVVAEKDGVGRSRPHRS